MNLKLDMRAVEQRARALRREAIVEMVRSVASGLKGKFRRARRGGPSGYKGCKKIACAS